MGDVAEGRKRKENGMERGWDGERMGWREDGRRLKEGGIKWSDRGKVK